MRADIQDSAADYSFSKLFNSPISCVCINSVISALSKGELSQQEILCDPRVSERNKIVYSFWKSFAVDFEDNGRSSEKIKSFFVDFKT
jgi:hypothetical protein